MQGDITYIDLDGVIADDRHRVKHAIAREWSTYFGLMHKDKVWPQGRRVYEDCLIAGGEVAYLTGRREDTREVTLKWLAKHGFDPTLPLVMRPEYDRRVLAELKAAIVLAARQKGYQRVRVYDDDPSVIAAVSLIPGAIPRHCTWYIKPERMVKRART